LTTKSQITNIKMISEELCDTEY